MFGAICKMWIFGTLIVKYCILIFFLSYGIICWVTVREREKATTPIRQPVRQNFLMDTSLSGVSALLQRGGGKLRLFSARRLITLEGQNRPRIEPHCRFIYSATPSPFCGRTLEQIYFKNCLLTFLFRNYVTKIFRLLFSVKSVGSPVTEGS